MWRPGFIRQQMEIVVLKNKRMANSSQDYFIFLNQVREFVKPKKQNKDYSGFFAQHQLPSNYTGYRAPPGTQHVGCADEEEEDGGTTDMWRKRE